MVMMPHQARRTQDLELTSWESMPACFASEPACSARLASEPHISSYYSTPSICCNLAGWIYQRCHLTDACCTGGVLRLAPQLLQPPSAMIVVDRSKCQLNGRATSDAPFALYNRCSRPLHESLASKCTQVRYLKDAQGHGLMRDAIGGQALVPPPKRVGLEHLATLTADSYLRETHKHMYCGWLQVGQHCIYHTRVRLIMPHQAAKPARSSRFMSSSHIIMSCCFSISFISSSWCRPAPVTDVVVRLCPSTCTHLQEGAVSMPSATCTSSQGFLPCSIYLRWAHHADQSGAPRA